MSALELVIGVVALGALAGGGAALTWGYINGKPVQLQLVDIGVDAKGNRLYLRADVVGAWEAMKAAAEAAGIQLQVNTAFRTFEAQAVLRALYEAGHGALAAEPGYSPHEAGIAVDLESAGGTNAAFAWLTVNALRFGWKRTVPSEPWHWEYV